MTFFHIANTFFSKTLATCLLSSLIPVLVLESCPLVSSNSLFGYCDMRVGFRHYSVVQLCPLIVRKGCFIETL